MNKRSIISLSILTVLAILSIWAFIFSKNIMKQEVVNKTESKADERVTMKELVITETKDGQKFWEVYADTADYNNGNNIAILKKVHGNFYKEGAVILSVMSPEAQYNSNTKEVKLLGGAEAANDKNIYLQAEEINWAGSNDQIIARGNVKIIKKDDGIVTTSNETYFSTHLSNIKLSGNTNSYVYETNHGKLK